MAYSENAVEVANVTKHFRKIAVRQATTLKTAFVNLIRGKRKRGKKETLTVLDCISFAVKKGTTFGIMGRNGAGKSTLLKLIAGIMVPTKGKIAVNGTLTPLLELGSGFHPELTGRENILINGLILGISKKDIIRKYDEIIDFAELRNSIDQPIRTYSSGMYVRLAFSIAVNINPDIILLDEVLAVGDAEFSKKSKAKIKEFKDAGKTIILVSHDPVSIVEMCDEALYLDNGKIQIMGEPAAVASAYKQIAG
ncbi:MAG: ABC transporter ATP-binding protein [bacterium]